MRQCYNRTGETVVCSLDGSVIVVHHESTPPSSRATTDPAEFDFYAGAQKVHDSNGSVSVDLAVVDHRFRVAGAFSHYFETQPDGGRLTMTMPSLTAGVRIDDLGATSVFVEGGAVHVHTSGDVMGDSSIMGAIGGVRIEHRLSSGVALLGGAQAMAFESGVRANAAVAGVRIGHLQAALRVLDFNVGPALYGPEIGLRF